MHILLACSTTLLHINIFIIIIAIAAYLFNLFKSIKEYCNAQNKNKLQKDEHQNNILRYRIDSMNKLDCTKYILLNEIQSLCSAVS